jgi:itaconate CoA-transferase
MSDVWAHPQLKERNRWVNIESPAGPIPAVLPPGISTAPDVRLGPVPALGQHTEALLSELGFSTDAIRELRDAAVV